jgi:hypothetical protein
MSNNIGRNFFSNISSEFTSGVTSRATTAARMRSPTAVQPHPLHNHLPPRAPSGVTTPGFNQIRNMSNARPFGGFADLYGQRGAMKIPLKRKTDSPNLQLMLNSDSLEERASVRTVTVIGYAEGSELDGAKNHYTGANVVGIETDRNAYLAASQDQRDGISVLKNTTTFPDAVMNQDIGVGDSDRIVMSYVAPYLNDQDLAAHFEAAGIVQKPGDKFSISTYGGLHAYAQEKGMNIKSASEMLRLAQSHGYALALARVNVARENVPPAPRTFTSAQELVDHDRQLRSTQNRDAWHTMEFVFKKAETVY